MADDRHTSPKRRAIAVGLAVLLGLGIGTTAALVAASFGWDFGLTTARIESTIKSWGPWGVAASVGLMVVHSFVPFPAEFLAVANGMVFGPFWGTVVTWVGAMLGAILAFGLVRWLGRPFVEVAVARHHWESLDEWSEHEGPYVVLVSRLIPVIAFNLINYAAGLSRISWWNFLWTTAVGILPLTTLMVIMGSQVHTLGWEAWALLFAGGLALWLILRRRLRPGGSKAETR